MSEKEIMALEELLKVNFSFNPVIRYGTGAIEFRGTMIEFWTNGKVRIRNRITPCKDANDVLQAMVREGLIRPQAVDFLKGQLPFYLQKQE